MMRVAIPLFGDEVSPRFGPSRRFLVAKVVNGRVREKQYTDAQNVARPQLPQFLASLGITKMICGGIEHDLQADMERHGIDVIWGVIGPASEAIAAFAGGTLHSDQFVRRASGAHRRRPHQRPRMENG